MATGSYEYLKQSGPVPVSMTNDYQFRALMQMNKDVLTALLEALLHRKPGQITSIRIKNPVQLGNYIEDKEFILDLLVEINGKVTVNIELQVINQKNWPERSLAYICREFDNLNSGEDYVEVRPVVQIGLLDFVLFKENPEFYASYAMMNEKTHALYTEKMKIKVMELGQSGLATEEDRKWKLDKWAQFFKAEDWEGIKMLVKELPVLGEAAETICKITADEQIRRQCMMRDEAMRRARTTQRFMEMQERELEEKSRQIARQSQQLVQKDQQLVQKDQQLAQKEQQIEGLARELAAMKAFLEAQGIDIKQMV